MDHSNGTSWASGTAARSSFDPVAQLDYMKSGGVEAVVTTSGAGLTYNVEWPCPRCRALRCHGCFVVAFVG